MKRLIVFLLLCLLSGCGYSFSSGQGAFPGDVRSLHIPLFANRTTEPLLETSLTNDVREVIAQDSRIQQVTAPEQAEAVLEGVVSDYRTKPLAYDQHDDISEYRSSIRIRVKLRRLSDGSLLWQDDLDWSAEYFAADDKMLQEDLEQQAIAEISRRLAEELYHRLRNTF
jgi:outer membrane lipopolysaccharide assembly protein LptE/RlpB